MNPEALKTSIVNVLEEIRLLMPPEARDDYLLTFAARRPSKPGWDVLVSEDSKDGLVELLRRRQDGVGGKAWTAGRDPEKVAALLAAVDRFHEACDAVRDATSEWPDDEAFFVQGRDDAADALDGAIFALRAARKEAGE